MSFANPQSWRSAKLPQHGELQMLISPSPINTSKQLPAVIKNQRSTMSMAPALTQVSPDGNLAPLLQ